MVFWKGQRIVPQNWLLHTLRAATSATLLIDGQKNVIREQVITQEGSNDRSNPVAHLVDQVYHILLNGGGPDDPQCTYYNEQGEKCLVCDYCI